MTLRVALRKAVTALVSTRLLQPVGTMIHRRASRRDPHEQTHSTWFMRNPPLLETLRDIVGVGAWPGGQHVRVCSLGCSTGAELYSTLFALRSARPDLHVDGVGIDVSAGAIEAARARVYRLEHSAASGVGMFNPGPAEINLELTAAGKDWVKVLFEVPVEGVYRVRESASHDTTWFVGDAGDPSLPERIAPQDFVLANNFLGPMADRDAERCLRNVLRMVRAGGYVVIDGVDPDVKMRVLRATGATPVPDRFDQIYGADPTKWNWPWERWAHEPIDRSRVDWQLRYGVLFRVDSRST